MTTVYEIGPFRLEPESGVLMRLGAAEPLGRRAVSVLAALVKNARKPMTKDAIIDAAWPGLVIEEANLSVQVSAIRRVLSQTPGGERWLETLAGRGYRFVGPVTELRDGVPYESPRDRTGKLPEPLASFIGRERELVELKRLLAKNRLLTLVGMGGIGKTRLAVQLAAEVSDAYRDGVWFVDLAPLADPELVPSAAAQTLEVQQTPGKSLTDALCRQLRGRRVLLIFDNCEHVLDASAQLIEALLHGASEPAIIATSREPLRVEGEQIFWVAPLPLPDPAADLESIRQAEAVTLFVDRAQHQQPDFALTEAVAPGIAQLCVHLDGIPLALELAAPLVHTHSIEEINAQVVRRFETLTGTRRSAPARHLTLRATLDWSHGLLPETERTVLRRVSVFRRGFTVQGACGVCADATISESAVSDLISRLVARSLVTAEPAPKGTRYLLLETVRSYALERLAAAGEADAANARHARFLCDFFEPATDDYWRIPDQEWRSVYAPEIDNVRAALDWAFAAEGDAAVGVRLCGASGAIWWELSLRLEGPQRIQPALARVGPETPELQQARLWFWHGYLGNYNLDEIEVLAACERAAGLSRGAGDTAGLGRALALLGARSAYGGRIEQARARLSQALPLLERAGQPKMLAECLIGLGYLEMSAGRFEQGLRLCDKAASLCHEAGGERSTIGVLQLIAYIHWSSGNLEAAITGFRKAAEIAQRLNRRAALGQILTNLAGALTEGGQLIEALSAAREGLPIRNEVGQVWWAIDHLALRACLAGKIIEAARLAGFADFAYAANHCTRQVKEAHAHDRVLGLLCEKLPSDELKALFAEGAKLSEDEACRLALED